MLARHLASDWRSLAVTVLGRRGESGETADRRPRGILDALKQIGRMNNVNTKGCIKLRTDYVSSWQSLPNSSRFCHSRNCINARLQFLIHAPMGVWVNFAPIGGDRCHPPFSNLQNYAQKRKLKKNIRKLLLSFTIVTEIILRSGQY